MIVLDSAENSDVETNLDKMLQFFLSMIDDFDHNGHKWDRSAMALTALEQITGYATTRSA